MKIVHQNFVYEAVGKVYTEEDIKTILEESGVNSLSQLHALLEAIEDKNKKMDEEEPNPDDVPDLQATPEEKEIEDAQANQQQKSQEAPVEPVAPEGGSEVPPIETEPEIPAETPVEEPADEPSVEPAPEPMVAKDEQKPSADKEQVPEKPLPIKEPPAVEPERDIPKKELKDGWLVGKTLKTLYNNYISFFKTSKLVDKVGTIIGLNAPGLKQNSPYLMANVTAFVQGSDPNKEPYSIWMVFRRKRATQNWSMNSPIEVRCTCNAFNYYSSYSLWKAHALSGRPARSKSYIDDKGVRRTINMTLPAKQNNPNSTPILCKHLALVTKKLMDNGLIEEN